MLCQYYGDAFMISSSGILFQSQGNEFPQSTIWELVNHAMTDGILRFVSYTSTMNKRAGVNNL